MVGLVQGWEDRTVRPSRLACLPAHGAWPIAARGNRQKARGALVRS